MSCISYKLVPGFEPYEISSCGRYLRDSVTGKEKFTYIIKPKGNKTSYRYTDIKNKSISIHRLVALAWIPNHDKMKNIVNHIDSNGLNNDVSNLEWVTSSENAIHGVEFGNRTDNIPCRVRHWKTGVITEFPSLARAKVFVGLNVDSPNSMMFPKMFGKLINGNYEARQHGDNRPWFYINDKPYKVSRYWITIKDDFGLIVEEFYNYLELFKKYPKYRLVYNSQVKNKLTTDTKTIISLIKDTFNINISVLDSYDFEWSFNKRSIKNCIKQSVVVHNPSDKIVIVLDSLRKAAIHFGVDRSVISNRLDTDMDYNGWYFKRET